MELETHDVLAQHTTIGRLVKTTKIGKSVWEDAIQAGELRVLQTGPGRWRRLLLDDVRDFLKKHRGEA